MTAVRIGSLFTGYGGLDMAVRAVVGGDVVWHSEIEPAAVRLLMHHRPDVPNLGDITAIDWSTVPQVDVLTGGFPCQDISAAGLRAGLRPDTRSGLWTHMAYAINQLRPGLVVIENVRGLLSADADCDLEPCAWCVGDGGGQPLRALGAVLGGLADIGYDARWCGLRAADVDAAHGRFRVFIVAAPADPGCLQREPWRRAGPGEASRRWTRGDASGCGDDAAPDAASAGRPRWRRQSAGRPEPAAGGHAPTDPASDRRDEGGTEPTRLVRGPDVDLSGRVAADASGSGRHPGSGLPGAGGSTAQRDGAPAPTDPNGDGLQVVGEEGLQRSARDDAHGCRSISWGTYEPAIRRWERIIGRVAPPPTEPGVRGGPVLSPLFVEWLMGLPVGHVTAVKGLTRSEQLKLLGNGVVPRQAAAALWHLLGVAS